MSNNKVDGSFYIVGTTKEFLLKTFGLNIDLNDNEVICPKLFYPSDDIEGNKFITSNKIVNLNNMQGQIIRAYYQKFIDDYNSEKRQINLKLIDTYDNNKNIIDENICYASRNMIKTIFDDAYKNIDLSKQTGSIIISIDNQNNFDKVKPILNGYGYEISSSFVLNKQFLSFVKIASYIIAICAIIFVIIISLNINKQRLMDRTKEFGIMRSLGCNKHDIFSILIVENLNTFILSIFYSLISIITIFSILKILVFIYPFIFEKIPIKLNYISFIIYSIIILSILIIESVAYSKKILNQDILVNINE